MFTGGTHPASSSHREVSDRRKRALGITEGLIRISVGIENVEDIYADIEQALEKAKVKSEKAKQGKGA